MTHEQAIQEAKDKVAKKHGYFNFRSVVSVLDSGNISFEKFEAIVTEAMLEYASSSSEKGDKRFSEVEAREIFKAGARRGYSQRSKMAGCNGTDDPDEDTYFSSLTPKEHSEGEIEIRFCKGEAMGGNCCYPDKSCANNMSRWILEKVRRLDRYDEWYSLGYRYKIDFHEKEIKVKTVQDVMEHYKTTKDR